MTCACRDETEERNNNTYCPNFIHDKSLSKRRVAQLPVAASSYNFGVTRLAPPALPLPPGCCSSSATPSILFAAAASFGSASSAGSSMAFSARKNSENSIPPTP